MSATFSPPSHTPLDQSFPAFELDGETFVEPQFAGRGLANVAPTVLHLLTHGRANLPLPPLDQSVLPARLTEGVRTVVLLVVDGLGHLQVQREAAEGNAPTLAQLLTAAQRGSPHYSYQAITSVFPTTTVAALGSLNSAVTPAEHGLLGYTLRLPELGTVGEMIRWGPLGGRGSFADAENGGASPEAFFWAQTLYQRLRACGINRAFAVNPSYFQKTALTRMLHQGADYRGYVATSSLSVMVSRLVRESDEPTYVYAYWPTVDSVTHMLGPASEEHSAEVAAFDHVLERLLDRLPARGDTLLMLTADHGHIETGEEREVSLNGYPDLVEHFACAPAGERRATYLYAKPGTAAALEERARAQLADCAVVMSRTEAQARGLFGPRPLDSRAEARIGDVLLFPRENLQFTYALPRAGETPNSKPASVPALRGMHGGLTPQEALVPLLAMRF